MFSTGSYHLPVMGLERKEQIDFEYDPPEGKRVTANTYGPSLNVPVSPRYTCNLETSCKNFAEDIFSNPDIRSKCLEIEETSGENDFSENVLVLARNLSH